MSGAQLSGSVNSVEDQRLLEDLLREQALEDAISISPVSVLFGKAHVDEDDRAPSGVTFQRCGGGRRVIRKKIGAQ